jgi:hypothetical protein
MTKKQRYACAVPEIRDGILGWEVVTYDSIEDRQPSGVLGFFDSHSAAITVARSWLDTPEVTR